MVKKRAKKDSESEQSRKSSGVKKRKSNTGIKKTSVEKLLVENFASLQNVMADLAGKFNNLANQMSKLLELFEQSAKTFMEKDLKFGGSTDKEATSKLDRLIEQNKIIAQGITMLHEEHTSMPEVTPEQPPMMPQQPNLPGFTQQMNNQENINKYQRSISSKQDAKIQRPGQIQQNPGQ